MDSFFPFSYRREDCKKFFFNRKKQRKTEVVLNKIVRILDDYASNSQGRLFQSFDAISIASRAEVSKAIKRVKRNAAMQAMGRGRNVIFIFFHVIFI